MFQSKWNDLDLKPTTLEELKFVLRTITMIRDMSLDMENEIRDVQERFRLIQVYELHVSDRL